MRHMSRPLGSDTGILCGLRQYRKVKLAAFTMRFSTTLQQEADSCLPQRSQTAGRTVSLWAEVPVHGTCGSCLRHVSELVVNAIWILHWRRWALTFYSCDKVGEKGTWKFYVSIETCNTLCRTPKFLSSTFHLNIMVAGRNVHRPYHTCCLRPKSAHVQHYTAYSKVSFNL